MSGSTVGNMLGLSAGEWVPAPGYNTRWHIDGFNTVVEADTHSSASPSSSSSSSSSPVMQFTMLLGVLLSDVCDDFSGNLMVWPQSHIDIQNHINKTGDLHSVLSTSTGMDQSGQGVALRNGPVFLKGKRGDVIMAHWQLAHSVAPNMSPNVRYCVYFRLLHSLHPPNTFVRKVMENVWLEYDGVRQYMEMKEKK